MSIPNSTPPAIYLKQMATAKWDSRDTLKGDSVIRKSCCPGRIFSMFPLKHLPFTNYFNSNATASDVAKASATLKEKIISMLSNSPDVNPIQAALLTAAAQQNFNELVQNIALTQKDSDSFIKQYSVSVKADDIFKAAFLSDNNEESASSSNDASDVGELNSSQQRELSLEVDVPPVNSSHDANDINDPSGSQHSDQSVNNDDQHDAAAAENEEEYVSIGGSDSDERVQEIGHGDPSTEPAAMNHNVLVENGPALAEEAAVNHVQENGLNNNDEINEASDPAPQQRQVEEAPQAPAIRAAAVRPKKRRIKLEAVPPQKPIIKRPPISLDVLNNPGTLTLRSGLSIKKASE